MQNKAEDGRNNITGRAIRLYRLKLPGKPSRNAFAALLQVRRLDIEKTPRSGSNAESDS